MSKVATIQEEPKAETSDNDDEKAKPTVAINGASAEGIILV